MSLPPFWLISKNEGEQCLQIINVRKDEFCPRLIEPLLPLLGVEKFERSRYI